MRNASIESRLRLAFYQALLLGAVFAFWYAMTTPGLVSEEFAKNTAFFFGKPLEVLKVIWVWFFGGKIYPHLGITLLETMLAFVVVGEYLGSAKGVGYLILQAEGVFDINTVFAGILVLTGFALLLDLLVTQAEERLLVWRPKAAETEAL